MQKNRKLIITLEMISFPIIIGLFNMIYPVNPGFYQQMYLPYMLFSFVASSFYNRVSGYISILSSIITIILLYNFIADKNTITLEIILKTAKAPLILSLLFIYIFGIISENKEGRSIKLKDRLKVLSIRNLKFIKELKGLKLVNRELEERISREKYSTSLLYEQIQKMSSLNFKKTLEVIIDTIELFTRATKISVWEYDLSEHNFRLTASTGWKKDDPSKIPVEDTIEGWVFRNSTMFSIRMILNNLQLQNLEKQNKRNIITFPIVIAGRTWGVINIEKMPFQKYNEYAETFIAIIIALSSPILQKAIDYENIIKKEEIDEITGLPSYSQFYNLLNEEINRKHFQEDTLSVVIFELGNYRDIVSQFGAVKVKKIFKKIAFILNSLSNRKARIFHYKEENQLAIFFNNQDYDGTSIFCLETLGNLTTETWEIDNQLIKLNYFIGFSALNKEDEDPNSLLDRAENLLGMQKVM